MHFAGIAMPTDVPRSFHAALSAAGAVAADADEDPYAPLAGADGETLIVNRVTTDGTTWTAVAGVTPDRTAVRVLFVNGAGRRGNMFDLPHLGEPGLAEAHIHAVAGLVLTAPRQFARRLRSGNILLDRLIQAAWQDDAALHLTPAGYRALERRLIAAGDPDGAESIRPGHAAPGMQAVGRG